MFSRTSFNSKHHILRCKVFYNAWNQKLNLWLNWNSVSAACQPLKEQNSLTTFHVFLWSNHNSKMTVITTSLVHTWHTTSVWSLREKVQWWVWSYDETACFSVVGLWRMSRIMEKVEVDTLKIIFWNTRKIKIMKNNKKKYLGYFFDSKDVSLVFFYPFTTKKIMNPFGKINLDERVRVCRLRYFVTIIKPPLMAGHRWMKIIECGISHKSFKNTIVIISIFIQFTQYNLISINTKLHVKKPLRRCRCILFAD